MISSQIIILIVAATIDKKKRSNWKLWELLLE